MSHESEWVARMQNYAPLTAILTGGIYAAENLPEERISRKVQATQNAFETNAAGEKILKPCALVVMRSPVSDGVINDTDTQRTSATFVMMVHLYQHRGYDQIDLAKPIIRSLFIGRPYAGVIEIEWFNTLSRARDSGALNGNSLERIDFTVTLVEGD